MVCLMSHGQNLAHMSVKSRNLLRYSPRNIPAIIYTHLHHLNVLRIEKCLQGLYLVEVVWYTLYIVQSHLPKSMVLWPVAGGWITSRCFELAARQSWYPPHVLRAGIVSETILCSSSAVELKGTSTFFSPRPDAWSACFWAFDVGTFSARQVDKQ